MCTRYHFKAGTETLLRLFDCAVASVAPGGPIEVRPTDVAPIVIAGAQGRRFAAARFGLMPAWAKDHTIARRLLNARGETVATLPGFRDAFRHRRCLVPASFFYEWQRLPNGTQPYRIGLTQSDLFAFAGLWEEKRDGDGEILHTFAIVTTAPNELIAPIHDRMPVILDPADYAAWLDVTANEKVAALLRPYPAAAMAAAPVEKSPAEREPPEKRQLELGI